MGNQGPGYTRAEMAAWMEENVASGQQWWLRAPADQPDDADVVLEVIGTYNDNVRNCRMITVSLRLLINDGLTGFVDPGSSQLPSWFRRSRHTAFDSNHFRADEFRAMADSNRLVLIGTANTSAAVIWVSRRISQGDEWTALLEAEMGVNPVRGPEHPVAIFRVLEFPITIDGLDTTWVHLELVTMIRDQDLPQWLIEATLPSDPLISEFSLTAGTFMQLVGRGLLVRGRPPGHN